MHTDTIHSFIEKHLNDCPENNITSIDALYCRLQQGPDSPFLTEVNGSIEQTYTYRELDIYSRRAAHWLAKELDLKPGDVFALAPRNNFNCIAIMFGAIRSGIIITLLNPNDPPLKNKEICDAVNAKSYLAKFPLLNELPVPNLQDNNLDPTTDAFYFVTSGSTSKPKIVAQTHRGATSNANAIRAHHNLKPGDRLLGCLPIHHVNGFHLTFMSALYCGSHSILLDKFDPFRYPDALKKFQPRIASVTPSILQALLITWRTKDFPDNFDYFISAAAPLSRQTAIDVWNRWKIKIMQGYGLSETNNFSTTMPIDISDEAYKRLMLDPHIPSIGIALQGNEVIILSSTGEQVSKGEIGEICIRGHNLMDRYVNNASATFDAFFNGWFHTGDLGFEHSDNEYDSSFFTITGRIKNIAKIRGQSLSLEEMEDRLLAIPEIIDAACVPIEDKLEGEVIAALIVTNADISDVEIRNKLSLYFSEIMLPQYILREVSIPRTPTGKILRPQLKKHCMENI